MRDTEWFARLGWGVFCHYLTQPEMSAEEWNRQVDAFDIPGLARQLSSMHAPYFFITLGQGSGHYCAPNETYDRIAGVSPSRCSKRDLISDLYGALHPLGIELLVYVPADGSWADMDARKGLQMTDHWNDGMITDWEAFFGAQWVRFRHVQFMRNWEAICRDWSIRFGRKVRGWWVDGCYGLNHRYPEEEEPNFRTFAAALRAGNPDAILAFNAGVKTPVIHGTIHEDYTAGEIAGALPQCPGAFVTGPGGHKDRYHILTPLGSDWGAGERPRFPDEMAYGYTRHITNMGGVITRDVPIRKGGLIPEAFVAQLKYIGTHMRPR